MSKRSIVGYDKLDDDTFPSVFAVMKYQYVDIDDPYSYRKIEDAKEVLRTFERYGGFSGLFGGYSYADAVPDPAEYSEEELAKKANDWKKYYAEYGNACDKLKESLELLVKAGVIKVEDLSPEYKAVLDGVSVYDVIQKEQEDAMIDGVVNDALKADVPAEVLNELSRDELLELARRAREAIVKKAEVGQYLGENGVKGLSADDYNSLISDIKEHKPSRYQPVDELGIPIDPKDPTRGKGNWTPKPDPTYGIYFDGGDFTSKSEYEEKEARRRELLKKYSFDYDDNYDGNTVAKYQYPDYEKEICDNVDNVDNNLSL